MRKFSKVFVGTMEGSNLLLPKRVGFHCGKPLASFSHGGVILHRLAPVVSGLIQASDMAKRSVSLSEINFAMAGYLVELVELVLRIW